MAKFRLTRRRVLYGAGGLVGTLLLGRCSLPWFLRARPIRPIESLSPEARGLVREAFADVDPALLWDVHAHVVGFGAGGTGCWVHDDMQNHLHPMRRLQFEIYQSASGVTDPDQADAQYIDRLLRLQRAANPEGRILLLGFDANHGPQGELDRELTNFYTPNEYVLDLARRHPEALACVSIHPYRGDALARLETAREAGAVAVKWLPNAMGIDPSDARCDPFYARLAEYGLPLLTHAGKELAVHAAEAQELGNPLRLRRALDQGVRVFVAHCASLGENRDLDRGGAQSAPSFDLFLRLMGESQYEENLFGEISALTLANRSGRPLREMLMAEDLHPRLVNGSDYPLPAIDPLVSTRLLAARGYLTSEDRPLLNEVFDANPLLFDYLVKRRLRVEDQGRTYRFAPRVFESRRAFG